MTDDTRILTLEPGRRAVVSVGVTGQAVFFHTTIEQHRFGRGWRYVSSSAAMANDFDEDVTLKQIVEEAIAKQARNAAIKAKKTEEALRRLDESTQRLASLKE